MSPTKDNVSSFPASPAATPRDARPCYSCGDILGATEGIKAFGDCCSAFALFLDDAQPGELRWLGQVLQERIEAPQLLEEAAHAMIRRDFEKMGIDQGLSTARGKGREVVSSTTASPKQDEAPDWLNDTPTESQYGLTMYGWDDDSIQDIAVDRGEFIALKAELGRIRGLAPEAK